MKNLFQPILTIIVIGLISLNINAIEAQSNWHAQYVSSQIQIDYSDPVNCSFSDETVQAEYIFLKISNLTAQSISVSFRIDVYYVGIGCGNCANDEYRFSYNVPANGTISTDCNFTSTGQSKLAIFKKFITKVNKREFEKFELTGIVIE